MASRNIHRFIRSKSENNLHAQKDIILAGKKISPMAFGCMQLTLPNGPTEKTAKNLIDEAIEMRINTFITAAGYGAQRSNEKLLGNVLHECPRETIFIGTKGGISFASKSYCQSPEEIRQSVEESLKNLQVEFLDLFTLHRIDKNASPENFAATIAAMKALVKEGKVKAIGLSEPTAAQIHFAQSVEPQEIRITVIESSYSIATRRAEYNGVLDACEQYDMFFMAYTSLLRGFINPSLQKISQEECENLSAEELQKRVFGLIHLSEMQKTIPMFSLENIRDNLKASLAFQKIAKELNCTPSQLSLAWLRHKNARIIPLPGTSSVEHLRENVEAMNIHIPKEIFDKISALEFKGNPNPPVLGVFDNDEALEKKVAPVMARRNSL